VLNRCAKGDRFQPRLGRIAEPPELLKEQRVRRVGMLGKILQRMRQLLDALHSHGVAALVEIESKVCKRFIMF